MFRTRLTRVFTVLLLCLSVVTPARAAAAMDAMEYKGYINKVFGYSLQYPDISTAPSRRTAVRSSWSPSTKNIF